ncbi:MAG: hypothetical protein OEY94_07815 [Alphaproteobacteria bacterium]|nr:hypothetical protein [Alphaproteobacteria bacterium]
MDEIQQRLEETSKNCFDAYGEWVSNKKNSQAQEKLHSSIHELRKVSSRLEIELAISERNEVTSKPLPIPPHRSAKGNKALKNEDDNAGNNGDSEKPKARRKPGSKTITIDSGNNG